MKTKFKIENVSVNKTTHNHGLDEIHELHRFRDSLQCEIYHHKLYAERYEKADLHSEARLHHEFFTYLSLLDDRLLKIFGADYLF